MLLTGVSQVAKTATKTTIKPLKKTVSTSRSSKKLHPEDYTGSSTNALKLRTTLAFQEKGILDVNRKLTQEAIKGAQPINLKQDIGNPVVVDILTKDGSHITDWQKFKTEKVPMPNGQSREIHFYQNSKTGKIDYETYDFKVKGEVKQ